MGAGSNNEPFASGNFFPGRKRRVAELFAKLLGSSFLPFPHFAAVVLSYLNVPLARASRQERGILKPCSLLIASPAEGQEVDHHSCV
jgi:hypothetical protein